MGQQLTRARKKIPVIQAAIKEMAGTWKLTAIGGAVGVGLNSACYIVPQLYNGTGITPSDTAAVMIAGGITGSVSTFIKANTIHHYSRFIIAGLCGLFAGEAFLAGRTEPVSLLIPALAGGLAGLAASRPERGQNIQVSNRHFD